MCNGGMPSEGLLAESLAGSSLVIGADGGGNLLITAGIVPDVVIGDLDSFIFEGTPSRPGDAEGTPRDFELIQDSDQETNDLEKALNLALGRGATEAVVLGATGLRLDHTLKNLSVLLQFSRKFTDIIFRDNSCDIRVVPKHFSMDTRPGQTVSLFPMSGHVEGIITDGLLYSLNNETLENGVRDGSSNKATGNRISIRYRSGDLLMLLPHDVAHFDPHDDPLNVPPEDSNDDSDDTIT